MQTVNIGVIGFGTIGAGVVEALIKKRDLILLKAGVDLRLSKVCDKDISTKRDISLAKSILRPILVKDVNSILNDPQIDIVVELIGGIHPAKEIIKKAIENGKFVVTANKALLCEEGKELFEFAMVRNRLIRFEGGVGGGIPIIKALEESLVGNKIQAIYGIVNGTSNYILWRMHTDRCDFRVALADAKKQGIAEKDATLDINGTDSAHKLALLSLLGFGKEVTLKDIYVEGIQDIEPCDLEYAEDLGYCIKLLAITKRSKNLIELRVHPTLLRIDHPLSSVRGIYNAIYVKGDYVGETLFYGQGAGRYPTTSAVISDIVDLAKEINRGVQCPYKKRSFNSDIRGIKPINELKVRFYIRFQAVDRPGVLAAISNILARHKISIASVKQVEKRTQKAVPIVMLTHEAQERSMVIALEKINRLSCIKSKPVAIRIEEL